jgi:hypothetical protein
MWTQGWLISQRVFGLGLVKATKGRVHEIEQTTVDHEARLQDIRNSAQHSKMTRSLATKPAKGAPRPFFVRLNYPQTRDCILKLASQRFPLNYNYQVVFLPRSYFGGEEPTER